MDSQLPPPLNEVVELVMEGQLVGARALLLEAMGGHPQTAARWFMLSRVMMMDEQSTAQSIMAHLRQEGSPLSLQLVRTMGLMAWQGHREMETMMGRLERLERLAHLLEKPTSPSPPPLVEEIISPPSEPVGSAEQEVEEETLLVEGLVEEILPVEEVVAVEEEILPVEEVVAVEEEILPLEEVVVAVEEEILPVKEVVAESSPVVETKKEVSLRQLNLFLERILQVTGSPLHIPVEETPPPEEIKEVVGPSEQTLGALGRLQSFLDNIVADSANQQAAEQAIRHLETFLRQIEAACQG